ncbi:hypothetical protein [Piscinibacter terrae]|uniref:Uncharacterized protein n=1 Tax=Piscinibacter terrae TaxID=2496871 RepID=A0A3N7HPJ4_9BURK|nr:hypothetical protein [Albitalea terrae]RQP23036.1 hypothetical protein DZC73_18075 [Albitalea terrae]
MLRDLCTVLEDLHQGLLAAAGQAGNAVRIAQAEMTLPMDCALVLQGGGCVLRADVARNAADTDWLPSRSRLVVHWGEMPTEVFS